ncbi:hypothetical protein Tco_0750721 [Tanacetum coccineum]|uniref:Uncharacterized protein n=1 Tax=Tanacetum coccineum TaxID=301880 RepID=A0ABQ4Z2A3_9ASTR
MIRIRSGIISNDLRTVNGISDASLVETTTMFQKIEASGDFLWRNDNDKMTVETARCNGKQELEEDGGLDKNKGEDNVLVESVNDWR